MKPARRSRIWICDACGKRETWRKGWRFYDCCESVNNSTPGLKMPSAVCSDECEDALFVQWRRQIQSEGS